MKITVKRYPANKLPDEVRGDIALGTNVNITVETVEEDERAVGSLVDIVGAAGDTPVHATPEEADTAIRTLRDQWV